MFGKPKTAEHDYSDMIEGCCSDLMFLLVVSLFAFCVQYWCWMVGYVCEPDLPLEIDHDFEVR